MTLNDIRDVIAARLDGKLRGSVRFDFTGLGSIRVDEGGATTAADAADVEMTAKPETFLAILNGEQNPVMAVMSRKLKIAGSPTRALKISELLAAG